MVVPTRNRIALARGSPTGTKVPSVEGSTCADQRGAQPCSCPTRTTYHCSNPAGSVGGGWLLGVDTAKPNWRPIAEAFTRREYIFEGDKQIYDAARRASDDFEHGKADLGGVRQTAEAVTRELFDLVRSAILTLTPGLDVTTQDALMAKAPVDISPFY